MGAIEAMESTIEFKNDCIEALGRHILEKIATEELREKVIEEQQRTIQMLKEDRNQLLAAARRALGDSKAHFELWIKELHNKRTLTEENDELKRSEARLKKQLARARKGRKRAQGQVYRLQRKVRKAA